MTLGVRPLTTPIENIMSFEVTEMLESEVRQSLSELPVVITLFLVYPNDDAGSDAYLALLASIMTRIMTASV